MSVANELVISNFYPAFSGLQPKPVTIASAATIAPTARYTVISGTVQLATITPPLDAYHELVLRFSNASPGAFLTSGNIAIAYTPIVNRPILMVYDPITAKYYPAAVV